MVRRLSRVANIAAIFNSIQYQGITMQLRTALAIATTAIVLLTATGGAVQRGEESVGAYMDDTAITATVKARLVEDKMVTASTISVLTLKGIVTLTGFAKTAAERGAAGAIARGVKGVTTVKNDIVIRP